MHTLHYVLKNDVAFQKWSSRRPKRNSAKRRSSHRNKAPQLFFHRKPFPLLWKKPSDSWQRSSNLWQSCCPT